MTTGSSSILTAGVVAGLVFYALALGIEWRSGRASKVTGTMRGIALAVCAACGIAMLLGVRP